MSLRWAPGLELERHPVNQALLASGYEWQSLFHSTFRARNEQRYTPLQEIVSKLLSEAKELAKEHYYRFLPHRVWVYTTREIYDGVKEALADARLPKPQMACGYDPACLIDKCEHPGFVSHAECYEGVVVNALEAIIRSVHEASASFWMICHKNGPYGHRPIACYARGNSFLVYVSQDYPHFVESVTLLPKLNDQNPFSGLSSQLRHSNSA